MSLAWPIDSSADSSLNDADTGFSGAFSGVAFGSVSVWSLWICSAGFWDTCLARSVV